MKQTTKDFVQDPDKIIHIVLNEPITKIELKDSYKEIFNDDDGSP